MARREFFWLVACAASVGALAQTAVINFEGETAGVKANGYTAIGHPDVRFTDTVGAGLTIGRFSGRGIGNRTLAVWDDLDGSKLQMDFGRPMTALSLSYGNDDVSYASTSDRAWLEIWNGSTLLHRSSLAMNLNRAADQTIAYTAPGGVSFTRAYFWYGDSAGSPFTRSAFGFTGMIEMVDNISYTVIPEPQSALAVGAVLGLAAWGFRRWRNLA